jgi:hypothetical protein
LRNVAEPPLDAVETPFCQLGIAMLSGLTPPPLQKE